LAERLALLRGVDPMQTQGLVAAVAHDCDRVTVGDSDHPRMEVFGVGRQGETQRKEKDPLG
jgi:hypothetical protein